MESVSHPPTVANSQASPGRIAVAEPFESIETTRGVLEVHCGRAGCTPPVVHNVAAIDTCVPPSSVVDVGVIASLWRTGGAVSGIHLKPRSIATALSSTSVVSLRRSTNTSA